MKRGWAVSVAALAHRLHALGMVSEWHYRSLCTEIGQRGYRRAEPKGVGREMSMVYKKVFDALRTDGTTKADLARDLRLHVNDVDALVFGLVLTEIEGGGRSGVGGAKGRLRLA